MNKNETIQLFLKILLVTFSFLTIGIGAAYFWGRSTADAEMISKSKSILIFLALAFPIVFIVLYVYF